MRGKATFSPGKSCYNAYLTWDKRRTPKTFNAKMSLCFVAFTSFCQNYSVFSLIEILDFYID